MLPLKDLAIKKALENNWQEARSINEQLLKENPCEIDSLNRLGFALLKLGKLRKAKETFKKALNIDKTNPIALKNLKKIDAILNQHLELENSAQSDVLLNMQDLFIEEAGKTKIVELKNIADKKTLSILQAGETICLIIKRSKVFAQFNNKYIGMLPEHIGARLIQFMKGGNEYTAYIKSVNDKFVSVFIRETKKSNKFKNQPSFASSAFVYPKDDDQT